MIQNLFRIRVLQLLRILKEIGIIRLVFLICFLFIIFASVSTIFHPYDYAITISFLLIILSIHLKRSDFEFLFLEYKSSCLLFFMEYLFISVPLLCIMALDSNLIFIPYVLSIFAISLIKSNRIRFLFRRKNYHVLRRLTSKAIPLYFFEWISGFRKQPLTILPFFIGIFFCKQPYVTSICIWLILAFISSFYSENEPIELILKDELPTNLFLKKKIIKHTLLFMIINLPLLILVLIFNFQDVYIISYSFIASILVFISIIIFKYATYYPSHKSFEFFIISSIALFSVIIFPLLLITFSLSVINVKRMSENLNKYLYAYN